MGVKRFKLEDNIPIPPKKVYRGPRGGKGNWEYPFPIMEVGQSFFVLGHPYLVAAKVKPAATQASKRLNRKFVTRIYQYDEYTKSQGVRVWRVE